MVMTEIILKKAAESNTVYPLSHINCVIPDFIFSPFSLLPDYLYLLFYESMRIVFWGL